MGESNNHPSKRTRERAYILARNAKQLNIPVGSARFSPSQDYMSYWFTNNIDYMVIFCIPEGYIAELWEDKQGEIVTTYLGIKNIRSLLSHIKKLKYIDVDESLGDVEGYIENEDNFE